MLIDSHENKRTIIRMKYMFEQFKLPVEVKEITVDGEQVADYANPPRWGVERKTLSDFWGSLLNKRIWIQVDKLATHFQFPALAILGGDLSDLLNKHPTKEEWIMSSLSKIEQQYDVRVRFFREEYLFGKYICYLDRYNGTLPTPTYKYIKKKTEVPVQQRILEQVDGIGEKLAKRILESYPTIDSLIGVIVEDDWFDVDGIGPDKRENIRKALMDECLISKSDQSFK